MTTPVSCRLSGGPFHKQAVRVLPTRHNLIHVEWQAHKPGLHTLSDGHVYIGKCTPTGRATLQYRGTLEDMRVRP